MLYHENSRVLILGAGKSGLSSARFLSRKGCRLTIADDLQDASLPLDLSTVDLVCGPGSIASQLQKEWDLVVASPGVDIRPYDAPIVNDIEIFYQEYEGQIVAVSGTNGKSTVTSLIAHILQQNGIRAIAAGNIGLPPLETLDEDYQVTVLEISSFQLESIQTFTPDIAVLLNISEDHLDRYDSYEHYISTKARLFRNQSQEHWSVLNYDDPAIRTMANEDLIASQKVYFSSQNRQKTDNFINCTLKGIHGKVAGKFMDFPASRTALQGLHNMENMAAAVITACLCGLEPEQIGSGLEGFSPLQHRMTPIREIAGVQYLDDSKGTNIGAVAKSLAGMERVILIAGGRNKGADFARLSTVVRNSCKLVIAIGEARHHIKEALEPVTTVLLADDMDDAVQLAHKQAIEGDTVLLSPGCASFDMFDSFEHRAHIFVRAVEKL
ncbi:UDP-N-acetylmuramoyl-L-alanine--D-glutamate ligase [Desulfurispira natronophila]|uniref:UDP-N-acetylmuramoylalanine--D-glutamate ligase n=1 Tax=Desulfurispira natronophila TaxID=682562 RepID=A0A7W7Y577_9BACT|nr:UDP-N-acetylmuramoyl-L-alanine--D-glutamate ligase [Desulfurispira natronophila]MBB5022222.1 UDP-N-acetylmuramoylalanine--D-glutamate ligase [Desulfurispira natronophila]